MNTITSVLCTRGTDDMGVSNNLGHLSSEHSVEAVDDILYDVGVRKRCLSSRLVTLTTLLGETSQHEPAVNKLVDRVNKKLKMIETVTEELNYLRGNLRAIERYTDAYISLLRDDKDP